MKKTVLKRAFSVVLALLLIVTALPLMTTNAEAAAYTGCLIQHDSRWGSIYIGAGTISATGCGILSLVNTVGYLSGQQMDVVSTAQWAYNVGGYNRGGANGVWRLDLYPLVQAKYGATYGIAMDCGSDGDGYWEGSSSTRLKNHLLKGGVAIGHVPNHFISIVGYDATTNKFHIYDSSPTSARGTQNNGGDVWVSQAALTSGRMYLDWFCLLSSTRPTETWIEKAAFDVMVYRDRNPDLAGKTDAQLKEHWLKNGIKEGRPSSTILDLGFYMNNNPDLKAAFGNDYQALYNHFITKGYKEHRKSSALFDGNYYCEKYPDVVTNYKDQFLRHYVDHGMAEGRRASLTFDPDYYWSIRPDVYNAWPDDYAMCARHYAGHGINAQIEAYDHESPVISNATVSNITTSGYTVTCNVTDNWELSKVAFPTWTTAGGQDDLADQFMDTQQGTRSGNTYTFQVYTSNHNYELGTYVTHIYAVDRGGNTVKKELTVEVKQPSSQPTDPVVPETPSYPVVPETPSNPVVPETPQSFQLRASAPYAIANSLLDNVTTATTVQDLLSQFSNSNLKVYDKNGTQISNTTQVGTGSTVKLYSGSTLVDSITVVVIGDVDGNSRIDTTDYMRIKAAFLNNFSMNVAEASAADVDHGGGIDSTDYMRVKAHFLGNYNLNI